VAPPQAADGLRLVVGQVGRAGKPFPGALVRAAHIAGSDVVRLGDDTTDAEGRYTVRYAPVPGFDDVNLVVTVLGDDGSTLRRSDIVGQAKPFEVINLDVPDPARRAYRVTGRVISRASASVSGLKVRIVDRGVGTLPDLELTSDETGSEGEYAVTFDDAKLSGRNKDQFDLQARVSAGGKFLAASEVLYGAPQTAALDVILPEETTADLSSEYETLTTALGKHYKGNLRDLKETDDRPDVSYLANKSGWDARAVALAALADQFSARSAADSAALAAPFFYALFRAGVSANDASLYHTDPRTVAAIWERAVAEGLIPKAQAAGLDEAQKQFRALTSKRLLESPALVGVSSFKDLLDVSLKGNAQAHATFAQIYADHRDDWPAFWDEIDRKLGQFSPRLKLNARLAYLTLNNAPLLNKLYQAVGSDSTPEPLRLIEQGYYKTSPWLTLIGDSPIPKEIPGAGREQATRYAEVMAAQLRFSFPTAVVAQLVSADETPLASAAMKRAVRDFLTQHQEQFQIGLQPVEQYVRRNNVPADAKVVEEVTRIQRARQITPTDEAMNALLRNQVASAADVARYDHDTFVKTFKDQLGGEREAGLIHAKARQVHGTVLNLAVSYLAAGVAPGIGGRSPAKIIDPAPKGAKGGASDVIAYPTLDKLFGQMDYCQCESCRSILSPAAYLVDLLQFCDPPAFDKQNPQAVLFKLRPDLQHLALTCENTNTPLPYIDIVNEALEYYIANGLTLDNYRGHDTDKSATPEELLANPQFVSDAAYGALAGGARPLPPTPLLPFRHALESVRRYFEKFEAPLPRVMEALRKNDAAERASDDDYGWRDILLEELRFSRAEYLLLSQRDPTAGDAGVMLTLKKLYGFPEASANDEVIAELSNARALARRVDISYQDLVDVLKTRFINPDAELIPRAERLGVTLAQMRDFRTGALTEAQFDEALAPHLDARQYGGDVKAWVKNDANFNRLLGLLTLAVPLPPWAASKVYRSGDCVVPAPRPAGSTLVYECTTPGTSTATQPAWPAAPGQEVKDGTVVWTCRLEGQNNFGQLRLRYANPDKVTQAVRPFEFVRLIRFMRLWKKLGWTIEQTDKALTALYPADATPNAGNDADDLQWLDQGFQTLLPRLGGLKRLMDALKLTAKKDLLSLLACIAPIDTFGAASLYRQMFLSPAALRQDDAFADDGYGNVLTGVSVDYTHPQAALEQAILDAAPNAIGYDNAAKRLSYLGVMDTSKRDALKALPGVSAEFQAAVDALYQRQRLASHREALRASARLTDDELSLILATLGDDPALTLDNVSAVYRHGWLARKLKLSVWELLTLMRFAFAPGAAANPFDPPVLHLVRLVGDLRAAGLKPTQVLYWIWNQDITGKAGPATEDVLAFARGLRTAFAAIDADFALVDDPDGRIAQERLALVYGPETTALFFSLVEETLVTEVAYPPQPIVVEVPYEQAEPALAPGILAVAGDRLAYDPAAKRLCWTGVLTTGKREAVKAVAGVTDEFRAAVDALYAENQKAISTDLPQGLEAVAKGHLSYDDLSKQLRWAGVLTEPMRDSLKALAGATTPFKSTIDAMYAENQKVVNPLFGRYDELRQLFETDLAPLSSVKERRAVLLAKLLPALRDRRKAQQALQNVSAAGATDVALATALLADPTAAGKFILHADGHADRPALDDLASAAGPGLSVQFSFTNAAGTTPGPQEDVQTNLNYSADVNRLPSPPHAGDVLTGVWAGYLEAPENGFYNIRVEADAGAQLTLVLGDVSQELTPTEELPASVNVFTNTRRIELRAGTLYLIRLTATGIKDRLAIRWETAGRGRELIPASFLYSQTLVDRLRQAYVRFLKAAGQAAALKLTPGELAYFAAHAAYEINGQSWLNSLPTVGDPDAETSSPLFTAFSALLLFARLKGELSPDDERLLAVLKDPGTTIPGRQKGKPDELLLARLTRWDVKSLDALLTRFGKVTNQKPDRQALKDLKTFARVHEAFVWLDKLSVSADVLFHSATNEPADSAVRDLQSALRARYEPADWLDVVKPIQDDLRALRRDALVAYVLHQMRSDPALSQIDTPDKLFEFFLMDVQMEPCMQTSRIRHALSSVQLFIERCLMNLEPDVASSSINAQQWEWMKRYRVWEANRKVFLWPENWLEPELRDDQSPFFKEAMSELLQGDVTEDRAAEVLLNYLSKLAEVSKLEPCGIHHVEGKPDSPAADVSHVVARTTGGANLKYYYRRRDGGSWTPWEQIKLDIQDGPVIPVVWRSRLFLFWVQVLQQGPPPEQPKERTIGPVTSSPKPLWLLTGPQDPPLAESKVGDIKTQALREAAGATKVRVHVVLCYSERSNGKWQPTRTSSIESPAFLGEVMPGQLNRSAWKLAVYEEAKVPGKDAQTALVVRIDALGGAAFKLYNAFSNPILYPFVPDPVPNALRYEASASGGKLAVAYHGGTSPGRDVLTSPLPGSVVQPCQYDLADGWLAPFFYFDTNHVFHVRSLKRIVTVTEVVWVGPPANVPHVVIPPIVQPPVVRVPDPLGPIALGPGFGRIDPSPIQRFVTEDVYVSRALGTPGTVLYGDKAIDIKGAVKAAALKL
jgi:hypothetical protein